MPKHDEKLQELEQRVKELEIMVTRLSLRAAGFPVKATNENPLRPLNNNGD